MSLPAASTSTTEHPSSSDHAQHTMAADATPLFSIPIPPLAGSASTAAGAGSIVCTAPEPGVFVLSWSSPPDNRQTTPFCRALLAALDALEFGPAAAAAVSGSVLVTTSAIAKFYSNGLDLAHAVGTPGFWPLLYQVWRRFLTCARAPPPPLPLGPDGRLVR